MNHHKLTQAHIDVYIRHLRTEERSAATAEKYLRDIRIFAGRIKGRPVTKESAAGWKAALLAQGLAPATVNAKLSAINGLFRFLGWDECRVKFLKVQRRIFRKPHQELARQEYIRLVEAARRLGRERLALAMETICGAGIRVSELRYITVEALKTGQADIVLKGKVRTIILPGKLSRKLLKYAQKQKIASGAIFRTKAGTPLSRFQIWKGMKSLCAEADVEPSKVFPHNLRHLFAATFYRATRDIVKLADVLGHSSVNTTRIYLLATGAEHARQLERLGLVS
ncbi:MAG: site-specific integrase [Oscillospiraceae bacterium]|nr:site-specific integrase [Oscillospiraceae bacterium]